MLKCVVVSREALASDDPYDLVLSNIHFVNHLGDLLVRGDEWDPRALQSYYVDYYLAQVNNGGFAQFLLNSHSIARDAPRVADGLRAMGALRHLALFRDSMAKVDAFGSERLEQLLSSDTFWENPDREALGTNDSAFYALGKEENLIALNSAWLRGLPDLVVVDQAELKEEAARQAALIPETMREARRARAGANRPEYVMAVDALCSATKQTLDRITAGDPAHMRNGQQTVAWHFLTNRGHFYYVVEGDQVVMFDGASHAEVARVPAPWL